MEQINDPGKTEYIGDSKQRFRNKHRFKGMPICANNKAFMPLMKDIMRHCPTIPWNNYQKTEMVRIRFVAPKVWPTLKTNEITIKKPEFTHFVRQMKSYSPHTYHAHIKTHHQKIEPIPPLINILFQAFLPYLLHFGPKHSCYTHYL